MTPQCKKVLDSFIKLANHSEAELAFSGSSGFLICPLSNSDIEQDFSQYSKEFSGIIQLLTEKGYIEFSSSRIFHITHKGLHYKWFTMETIVSFLFRSVLVPIFVAFVTALLVSYFRLS